jgi:hypothetical protein
MPRVMNAYGPFEIVVTPNTTHVLMDHIHDSRRIFTDGREGPQDIEPSFSGYSIGTWVDEKGDGRHDVLIAETRGLKVLEPTTPAAFLFTATTRPWSRNESISTDPIGTHFLTSLLHRCAIHPALKGGITDHD